MTTGNIINPFLVGVSALCTLKTPQNLWFSCVFMGLWNGNVDQKWVKLFLRPMHNDDDDELFLRNSWPMKGVKCYFQPGPLSEILTITYIWHTARIWTCPKPEFRLCWMKLCNSNLTTATWFADKTFRMTSRKTDTAN